MELPQGSLKERLEALASDSSKDMQSYSSDMMLKSIKLSMDRLLAGQSDMVEMLEVLLQEHTEDSPREMI